MKTNINFFALKNSKDLANSQKNISGMLKLKPESLYVRPSKYVYQLDVDGIGSFTSDVKLLILVTKKLHFINVCDHTITCCIEGIDVCYTCLYATI